MLYMKAASGELNLTVITLIAIAAVSGFFLTFMWPKIKASVNQQWNDISTQRGDTNTINGGIK